MVLSADAGGVSPHTRSTRTGTGTARPRSSMSTARTARRRACPGLHPPPPAPHPHGPENAKSHEPLLVGFGPQSTLPVTGIIPFLLIRHQMQTFTTKQKLISKITLEVR